MTAGGPPSPETSLSRAQVTAFAFSPAGRRHLARWLVVLLGLLGFVLLAAHLEEVTTPFLFGLLVAYILDPLVVAAERRGVRRDAAVIVLFGAVLILSVVAIVVLSLFVAHGVEELAETLVGERLLNADDPETAALIEATKREGHAVGLDEGRPYLDLNSNGKRDPGPVERVVTFASSRMGEILQPGTRAQLREQLKSSSAGILRAASEVGETLRASAAHASHLLSYVLLVPLYTFFLLNSLPEIRAALRDHLPGAYRGRIVAIATQIDRQVAAFFRGKLMVAGLKGLVTAIGLAIAGVPFGPLIGLGAGLLSVVPLAGPVCGVTLSLILSFDPDHFAYRAILIGVVFAVAEVAEGVAQPVILGSQVGLSPLTLILALFAFGHLFGLLGVLLAVPIACVVKVLFTELLLPEIQALAREPGPPPDTPPAIAAPAEPPATAAMP